MRRIVLLLALTAVWSAAALAADPLDELRRTFTIGGKPVPPQIFADFGDAIIADNRPAIVTVDALPAMHSNRYADPITANGRWVEQRKPKSADADGEIMAYKFIGTTANKLLVVVASWSGGGTGVFYTLHIVDAAWIPAFDEDGSSYRRLNLTLLRSYILGDRWTGDVKIAGNAITVVTETSRGGHGVSPVTLQARRP